MSLQTRLTDLVAAIGVDIKDLKSKTTLLSSVSADSWHTVGAAGEPAYQGTWAAAGTTPIRFRKDPSGRVWIYGAMSGGVADTAMFTLPVGYRPVADYYYDHLSTGGAAGGYVLVGANGQVTPHVTGGYLDLSFDTGLATVLPVLVSNVAQEAWHTVGAAGEPAYQGAWVELSAGLGAQFKKNPAGVIRISGRIKSGVSGTTAFTLPVGYRPSRAMFFLAARGDSTSSVGFVVVNTDGTVVITSAATSDISLFIEFDTGQLTFPAGKSIIPVVSVLPAGPTDGDEIYFQTTAMATANTPPWHLRYRATNPDGSANASAYKWEFLGGGSLSSLVAAFEGTASAGFADVTTVGPSVTLPLAGDYTLIATAQVQAPTANLAAAALKLGAAATSDEESIVASGELQGGLQGTPSRTMVRRGLAAAAVIKMQYRSTSGTSTFGRRELVVRPERVG